MELLKFKLLSWRAKAAGAAFGLVCSLATLAAVVLVFASASGERDPLVAKMKAAPAASEVAVKVPAKPVRG